MGNGMRTIVAIETTHAGVRFRSRLEARWAVFFDALGVKWLYEIEAYALPSGRGYLPDFSLPGLGAWLEVKPANCDDERWDEFVGAKREPLIVAFGIPAQCDMLRPADTLRGLDFRDCLNLLGCWRAANTVHEAFAAATSKRFEPGAAPERSEAPARPKGPVFVPEVLTESQLRAQDRCRALKAEILEAIGEGNETRARELMRTRDAILRGAL